MIPRAAASAGSQPPVGSLCSGNCTCSRSSSGNALLKITGGNAALSAASLSTIAVTRAPSLADGVTIGPDGADNGGITTGPVVARRGGGGTPI
jgi:hypothetical protein